MVTFYLQIFTDVQCGFLLSRGTCFMCKKFHHKSYESCPQPCNRTLSLTYPHTEESRDVKSGHRGGEAIVTARPIQATTLQLR